MPVEIIPPAKGHAAPFADARFFSFLAFLSSVFSHVLLAGQRLVFLDRLFLPDDAYYVLAIARNLAHGRGPSTDGVILTSGFQPLIAFLLTPVFLLTSDRDIPVYTAIAIGAIFGVLNTGLVGLIVAKVTQSTYAAALAMAWAATCPVLLRNDLNGLETSMAAFFVLLLIYLMGGTSPRHSWLRAAAIGVCAGLALLARVDNACIILLVVLWSLARKGVRWTSVLVGAAAIIVIPWWSYCFVKFGSVIPESGAAVRQIVCWRQERKELTAVRACLFSLWSFSQVLGSFQRYPLARLAVGYVSGVISAAPLFGSRLRKRADGLFALAVVVGVSFVFYTFYLPAAWFLDRYFHFVYLATIIAAVSLAANWLGTRTRSRKLYFVATGIVLVIVASNISQIAEMRSLPQTSSGGRGFAREVISVLPAGARVGAMQSGALGYYAERGIRVVNLDGVVNGNAYRAIKEKRMAAYLKGNSVGYFADWLVNAQMLDWAQGQRADLHLLRLAAMRHQGDDQFIVYKVVIGSVPIGSTGVHAGW